MPDPLKVACWNNIPAPYMVDRFNAVALRQVVDLEVWFTEVREPDRSWVVNPGAWLFPHRMARVWRYGGTLLGVPPRVPLAEWPDVVAGPYAGVPYLIGFLSSRIRGGKTGLWVEVTFDAWVRRTWAKEWLKRYILSSADGILTPGKDGRRYASRYGALDARIHEVPHVIDAALFRTQAQQAALRRDRIRHDLGLTGVTFIYVGRLWSGKGTEDLLTAFKLAVRVSRQQGSLLLVGDGIDEEHLRRRCLDEGIDGVVFAGFHQQDEAAAYYAASDVFVFPTLGDPYGLVVDEAMACSLPILSSDAAGEINGRVVDGLNGFLFKAGDASELAGRMVELIKDEGLRERMGFASWDMVAWESPERWAQDFERAVLAIASS